jgi:hypothetical protein
MALLAWTSDDWVKLDVGTHYAAAKAPFSLALLGVRIAQDVSRASRIAGSQLIFLLR